MISLKSRKRYSVRSSDDWSLRLACGTQFSNLKRTDVKRALRHSLRRRCRN